MLLQITCKKNVAGSEMLFADTLNDFEAEDLQCNFKLNWPLIVTRLAVEISHHQDNCVILGLVMNIAQKIYTMHMNNQQ